MMQFRFILLATVVVLSACNKDNDLPNDPMSVVPEIELISTGPTTVVALTDSIEFLLHYQDGDGDLGYNSPDSLSLYITDDRIGLTEELFVPLLAPEDAQVSIQGELLVELHNTILIDPESTSETVTFTIYLRDRAGNVSNTVTSQPVTVVPE
jgi:hypothetical protein